MLRAEGHARRPRHLRPVPSLFEDDQPLVPLLAARGVDAHAVIWNDPAARWSDFAALVIRNPWDYYLTAPAFFAWVERVGGAMPLVNPLGVLRWNGHKGYLRDLSARGIATVPTAWVARAGRDDLGALLAGRGWDDAVVKPAVSAGAHDTLRVRSGDLDAGGALLARLVARGDALVQPYLPSVEEHGERSLVYLGGVFSHAIRKHPLLAPGGVDPQLQTVGVPRVEPSAAERAFADRVLAVAHEATGERLAYARVDIAPADDGTPLLMELEAMEPCLFLARGEAHARFADVLAAALRPAPPPA